MNNQATVVNLTLYDDVEVHPFAYIAAEDMHLLLEYHERQRATYWSVCGCLKTGGLEELVDCVDEQSAYRCAAIVHVALRAQELSALAAAALAKATG